MNARRTSNIIIFRATVRRTEPPRCSAKAPALRAIWCEAPGTGRLECTWTDAAEASESYSRAA